MDGEHLHWHAIQSGRHPRKSALPRGDDHLMSSVSEGPRLVERDPSWASILAMRRYK